jgi:hypothetical protein
MRRARSAFTRSSRANRASVVIAFEPLSGTEDDFAVDVGLGLGLELGFGVGLGVGVGHTALTAVHVD